MTRPLRHAERRLRKDAERNRQRLITAAAELFAQRGLTATLNDVAHHARLGVGTAYRRFSSKAELIDLVYEQRLREIVPLLGRGLADPDPWHGLTAALHEAFALQRHDRGLQQLIASPVDALPRVAQVREILAPMAAQLLRRAQTAGSVRADISIADLRHVQTMLCPVLNQKDDDGAQEWQRCLGLLLAGMAPRQDACDLFVA